jgi:hypothetical protein
MNLIADCRKHNCYGAVGGDDAVSSMYVLRIGVGSRSQMSEAVGDCR